MTDDARREILSRLRSQRRSVGPPGPWRSRRGFDDLAAQFETALETANGEVIQAADLEEATERLDELLQELRTTRVVANAEAPLTEMDLRGRWPEISWHIVGQSAGNLRAFCADADVGLSGARAALAETGSIVLHSGPGSSRLTTLLPPVHIALVPVSRLTTDIFSWVEAREKPLPANITLVSGPSKTADIEQTLATGVHGPGRLIVILYQ
ncbi:MAG: lactate utilization protein [Candidatus Promineifilaceae bacterium]|nr:lactate utilization protein [Candidatus Promineifilaceae bacterium]